MDNTEFKKIVQEIIENMDLFIVRKTIIVIHIK